MYDVRRFPGVRFAAVAFFFFLYVPIGVLVILSFNNGESATVWKGLGLNGYANILRDAAALHAAGTSFAIASISAAVACLTTLPVALHLWTQSRVKGAVTDVFVTFPLLIPEIVLAIGTLVIFSFFSIRLNFWTTVFGHTVFCIPLTYLPIRSALARVDQRWIDAAADLGANPRQSFAQIVWPLIQNGVFAGFSLAFIVSIDDFVTTYFLSGSATTTLPMYIYGLIKRGVKPDVNALATVVLVVSFAVASLSVCLSRATASGKQLSITG